MNKNKVIELIENKEWDRLIAVATYEKRQKQVKLCEVI